MGRMWLPGRSLPLPALRCAVCVQDIKSAVATRMKAGGAG